MQHKAVYYSASSLNMFRVSTTPIMSTQNCNYSLRYCAATSLQRGQLGHVGGRQVHPSSGVHKTVTTASGTVYLPLSNVANLATLEGGRCIHHQEYTKL